MAKRKYTKVQGLAPEMQAMAAEGKSHQEIARHFGFQDKMIVARLLERERRRERKMEAGIVVRPKGRPRKDAVPRELVREQEYEIKRLKMENQLLRDFLRFTERE